MHQAMWRPGTRMPFPPIPGSEKLDLSYEFNTDFNIPSQLDIVPLQVIYGVLLNDLKDQLADPESIHALAEDPHSLERETSLFLPDLLDRLGYDDDPLGIHKSNLLEQLEWYSNFLGVIRTRTDSGVQTKYYPAMYELEYDEDYDIITFKTPYIVKSIINIALASIQTDETGRTVVTHPYTYLLYPHITAAAKGNADAVDIVYTVVRKIANCGDDETPRIAIQELVNKCPNLKAALSDKDMHNADKTRRLKNAFSDAWKLLADHTDLKQAYKNIQIPKFIPTLKTLDTIIEFPHDGKNEGYDPCH